MRARLQLTALVFLAGLALLREAQHPPGSEIEAQFRDWVIANSGRAWRPADLAVITISDDSVAKRPWPWSPLDYALFMQAALPWEPSVIGIEPALEWADAETAPEGSKQRQYERILQDYLRRAPKVLLGAELGFPDDADIIPPLQVVPLLRQVKGSVAAVPEFTSVAHQPKEEMRLGSTIGFTNAPPESGTTVRAVPLLFRYRGQIVPAFTLQAMMLAAQLTPDEVRVELGREIDLGGKMKIPIDAAGNLAANFAMPIARYDFEDLLLAAEQRQNGTTPVIAPEALHGKIILLIRDDSAPQTFALPNGRKASPGGLIAAALATMQSGSFIRNAPVAVDWAILAAIMVFAWFAVGWRRLSVLWVSAVALLAYLVAAIEVAHVSAVALPFLLPAGLLIFVAVAQWIFRDRPARAA